MYVPQFRQLATCNTVETREPIRELITFDALEMAGNELLALSANVLRDILRDPELNVPGQDFMGAKLKAIGHSLSLNKYIEYKKSLQKQDNTLEFDDASLMIGGDDEEK